MPYWILEWTPNKEGDLKPNLFGSYSSELAAEEYKDEANMSDRAKIYRLGTANTAKATQLLKAMNVLDKKDVTQGMQRFRHPKRRF